MIAGILNSRSTGGAKVGSSAGSGTPPPSVDDGVNEISNSKWDGGEPPTDWYDASTGTGAVSVATADAADHAAGRFVSGDGAARRGKDFTPTAGQRYVISIYCTSPDTVDADINNVVINWFPFASLSLVSDTVRPLASDLVAGERVYCIVQANVSEPVGLRFGPSTAGNDITLERPMVDNFDQLRGYVATDPTEQPTPGSLDLDTIPYAGQYEGYPTPSKQNNARPLSTPDAKRWDVRRSGTITAIQFLMSTNQADGETTKSSVAGSSSLDDFGNRAPHGYPAEFPVTTQVYRTDSALNLVGSPVFDLDWVYRTKDGSAPYSRSIVQFDNATHGLSIPVTAGETLMVVMRNRASNVRDDWLVDINGPAVFSDSSISWAGIGRSPPEGAGIYWGDGNTSYEVSGTSCSPRSRGPFNQLGVVYSDGVVDGCLNIDASFGAMQAFVGGSSQMRQTFTASYYRRASGVIIYAWHRTSTVPAAPMRVTISGADISDKVLDIPAADFPAYGGILLNTAKDFSSPLTLSPSTTYTVLLTSAGSASNAYTMGCIRKVGNVSAGYLPADDPPMKAPHTPGAFSIVDRHSWKGGEAEKSANSGASWAPEGYSSGSGQVDLPFALVLGGNVADTLDGLV